MQRMCRRLFAAVVGLVAAAGAASAQSPPPGYLAPVVPIQALPNPVAPAPGTTVMKGQGWCANCTTAVGVPGTPYVQNGQYGPGCNNGCGSLKADCGFIFGSCKSFFDPCGPLPAGGHGGGCGHCGGHGRFGRNCPILAPNPPYGTGYNGCCYDSYLNH